RTGGVDVDTHAVTRALDVDTGDHAVRQLFADVVADREVLVEVRAVLLLVREPFGLPVGRDTETEAVGIDLLAHQRLAFLDVLFLPAPAAPPPRRAARGASSTSCARTITVTCAVGLWIRFARPYAR